MPTKITDGNHGDSLQGSPEKRVDLTPDGTLWALVVVQGANGKAKFFRSTNGGTTWAYASGSDIDLGQSSTVPSFFIDADGYAHVSHVRWDRDPQVLVYSRGTPTGTTTTGRGWSWSHLTISPANGRTGVDTDVIAFRSGSGWVAWVSYDMRPNSGAKVARVGITSTGALSVTTTQHGPSTGAQINQYGSLEFNHTGDGVTPAASPHLFFTTGVQGTSAPLRLNRASYSGGTWTWDAPVTLATVQIDRTTLATTWDGTRLMVAWAGNTGAIFVSEWDGVAAPTARNPPAMPGGVGAVAGLSLSCDPATADIYLSWYDITDGDIRWSKFTRGANTWSAWAIAVTRTASSDDGKVQLVRHPKRDSVDMVYATGSGSSWQIWSQQLSALVRTPTAPTLLSPADGARHDLAAGATFTWQYNSVSPGDTQQAWAFRRTFSSTTEYWNAASQTWSGSIVWNTGSSTFATFAAGKWTNGTTYTWSVRTRSSTGADSVFAPDRTVISTAAPVVVVTAPIGIHYGESTPLVTWTYTGLDAQRDYQVRIIPEQAGIDPDVTLPAWDSGVVSSSLARMARVATALTSGVAYRAYVRATSSTAVTSAWSYTEFTIQITPPQGPLVELLDTIEYTTGVPRARLDILGQSSFLTEDQDKGTAGWENDTNTTVEVQSADTSNQLFAGVKMTSVAAGLMGIRTEEGDPPLAPYGQPQPLGPLSFPVIPGVPYTAVVSIRAAGTSRTGRVRIRWYDADDGSGALISESVGNQESISSVFYNQVELTDEAPATARLGRMVIEVLGPTAAGEIFYTAFPSFHPGRHSGWQPGGYSSTQVIKVERSDDGGTTWNTIIERVKTSLAQQATAYDRLMPLGIDVKYRAYTIVDLGDGSEVTSQVSLTATIALNAPAWAVRDPEDDQGEMNAYVVAHKRRDDEASSVHRPAGREYPIVDTEGLYSAEGTLSIFVKQADIAAAEAVLRRVVPMIVQSPTGNVYRVRMLRRDYNVEALRHRVIDVDYVDVD